MSNSPKTHQHSGAKQPKKPRGARKAAKKAQRSARPQKIEIPVRVGTKQAILIEMLSHPKGVAIAELEKAIGWQAHSIRGAISGGLKKKLGLNVTSEKVEGRGRVYRIQDAR
jgi:hypothetical protein